MKISFFDQRTGKSTNINEVILKNSVELNGTADLDAIIEEAGKSKYVLLGESTHGTHEYYKIRTQISKKLIEQKGFSFIAVEGDWPDCYKLNRYIKGYPESGKSAFEVLHTFNRWPTWMWANWETVALAEWLKGHNANLPLNQKAGFYGLDVYSLWDSMNAVIKYLDKKDPETRKAAIKAFKCFEPYSEDEGQSYAKATVMVPESCEKEVVDLLIRLRKNMASYNTDMEAVFSAEQNAHVIVNAEKYYRSMVRTGPESWNIRDHHMTDTLYRLMKFHGQQAKAIVWEYNTHIGDARFTDMSKEHMVNVGQILREQQGNDKVCSVGLGCFKGEVIAGEEWGDVMRVIKVPEAIVDSWEHILHQLDAKDRIIFMNDHMKKELGKREFGHRAIGVVYRPRQEFLGNYVPSIMPYRYDLFIYLDKTSALHPLHLTADSHLMPETFPFGT